MGGSTAYMGVKSNNRVKPNNLVEVRLSCGCVGVLTIFFLLQMNETFVRTQLVPLSVGLCQTKEHNPTSDIKDISSKTCKTSDLVNLKLSFLLLIPEVQG